MLDKKYRPSTYDQIVGNQALLKSLKSITDDPDNLPSSILLTGPSGCGKTTLSRIIATEIGSKDVQELNISNTRGIDDARNIIKKSRFKSLKGNSKVIILNEVHEATKNFQNAMLEVLEEPPKGVLFILCTTEPEKLLKTIRTRCSIFKVSSLTRKEIKKILETVIEKEDKEVSEDYIKLMAKLCNGSARTALVMLDSCIDLRGDEALEIIENYEGSENKEVKEFCYYILQNKKPKWDKIKKIISKLDIEPESARYAVLGFLNSAMLKSWSKRTDGEISDLIDIFTENFFYSKQAGLTNACYLASGVREE